MGIKVAFISLGCDKNLADSEKMLAGLNKQGYELTDDITKADAVIINTCAFIHDAKQESINTILETAEYKKTGNLKLLIVTGCLATRYSKEISNELEEVDVIVSSSASDELGNVLDSFFKGTLSEKIIEKDRDHEPELYKYRLMDNLKNYAYIKIADGCDKHCTYCAIPSIKGRYRSFPFEEILKEAEDLVEKGRNELILVAQETTLYGTDIYGKKRIGELLRALNSIEGLKWIRLMYCYPEEIDDDLIMALRDCEKVVKYIDMPIQHISDHVLKSMGRKTCGQAIKNTIKKLREEIPQIVIRTSLITGFPGETEEDHRELVSFLNEYKLERVGVFTYSKEEGTPAFTMKGQILKKEKERRKKELMIAQQKIAFSYNRGLIGHIEDVMIEGRIPEDDVYVGRSYRDAPDVDGCCFVRSSSEIISGDMRKVRIIKASGYDLIAEEVKDECAK